MAAWISSFSLFALYKQEFLDYGTYEVELAMGEAMLAIQQSLDP